MTPHLESLRVHKNLLPLPFSVWIGQGGTREGKKLFSALPQATPMRFLPPGIHARIKGEKQKNLKLVKELPMLRTNSSSKCPRHTLRYCTLSVAGS